MGTIESASCASGRSTSRCCQGRSGPMPRADVYWVPGPWPGRLGIVPRPRGGDWLGDEMRSWKDAGLSIIASLLTSEEVAEMGLQEEPEMARRAGLEFRALPIPDLGVPPSRSATAELVAY